MLGLKAVLNFYEKLNKVYKWKTTVLHHLRGQLQWF